MLTDEKISSAIETLRVQAESMGNSQTANLFKSLACIVLYTRFELILDSDDDPIPLLRDLCASISNLIEGIRPLTDFDIYKKYVNRSVVEDVSSQIQTDEEDILKRTTDMYANLFLRFDDHSYYDEAYALLAERFNKNGVPFE